MKLSRLALVLAALTLPVACGTYDCNDEPPDAHEGVPVSECWDDVFGGSCCSYSFGKCEAIICSNTCWEDKGGWFCGGAE